MNNKFRYLGILSIASLVLLTAFAFTNANGLDFSATSDSEDCAEASGNFNIVGTVTASSDDSLSLDVAGGTTGKLGLQSSDDSDDADEASPDSDLNVEVSISDDTTVTAGNQDADVEAGRKVQVKGELSGDCEEDGLTATSIRILGGANASGSVDAGDDDSDGEDAAEEDDDSDDANADGHVKANGSAKANANANANANLGVNAEDDYSDDANEEEDSNQNSSSANANAHADVDVDAGDDDANGHADANIGLQVKEYVHGLLDK